MAKRYVKRKRSYHTVVASNPVGEQPPNIDAPNPIGEQQPNDDASNPVGGQPPNVDAGNDGHSSAVVASSRAGQLSNITQRNVRKGTEMHWLWGMKAGNKLDVELDAESRPIREGGSDYTRFLGTVARRPYLFPLSHLRWDHIPKEHINSVWADEIEPRFHFFPQEHTSDIKKWSFHQLNEKWRQWKHGLKDNCFDYSKSENANVDAVKVAEPNRVDVDQYRILVQFWLSNKGKELSETNKVNVAKYKDPHCAGSKPFHQIAIELAEKNEGVKPTRGMIYTHTRKNKKEEYVNLIAGQYGGQLEKLMAKKREAQQAREKAREENPEIVEDVLSSDDEKELDNDDYAEVKGKSKRGRLNCSGHRPNSMKNVASGSHSAQQVNRDLAAQVKQQAEKMEEMKRHQAEEMERMEKIQDDMRKMIEALAERP